jgi:hypothetical protein
LPGACTQFVHPEDVLAFAVDVQAFMTGVIFVPLPVPTSAIQTVILALVVVAHTEPLGGGGIVNVTYCHPPEYVNIVIK